MSISTIGFRNKTLSEPNGQLGCGVKELSTNAQKEVLVLYSIKTPYTEHITSDTVGLKSRKTGAK